ncbi:hypothetical protein [Christiangramia sabulilitoris]|uniref:Lipocalin-like domain-containing protein n=1 Tax=Christiangramia sabulilitoris TaxID=2583991 RepID=A0A550I771_9FLAO|nr:hypothetical protein [Christiangramia sabulilitoris]TRO66825.1 hypothetical protein FGM01_02725 [Christiangramia sabulilitoris]
MKNRILVLILSIATLYACSSDSLITDEANLTNQQVDLRSNPIEKAVTRPFKIKAEGDFSLFPGDGVTCPAIVLNAPGEGTATHLGFITMFEEWCFNGEGNNLGTRTLTLTAANGDELHGTHSYILWTSPTSFEEVLVFDGGTGRFENATGEFNESVVITFDTEFSGTFTMSGDGTLTY